MIYVYTMGKVGSQSVLYSLKEQGFQVEHMHYIFGGGEFNSYRKQGASELRAGPVAGDKVISLVREPLGRNLSAYYHNNEQHNLSTNLMYNDFIMNYNHSIPDIWFHAELNRLFDHNFLRDKFDTEAGYKIYNDNLMIIRLEDLDSVFTKSFYEFTGNKDIYVKKFNDSKKKYMSERYYELKKRVYDYNLVKNLEMMYNFYTNKEVAGFRKLWGPDLGK